MCLRGADSGNQHLCEGFALQIVEGQGGAESVARGGSGRSPEVLPGLAGGQVRPVVQIIS